MKTEQMKNLKLGDIVKMVNCGEAEFYPSRLWTCTSDSFMTAYGSPKDEVVFLDGISGYFLVKCLELVEVDYEDKYFKENNIDATTLKHNN